MMIENKEKKKKALLDRVVTFDETAFIEQDYRKPIKNKRKKMIVVLIIVAVVVALILFFLMIRRYKNKLTIFTKTVAEVDVENVKTNVNYESFKNGFIRYSNDGASYLCNDSSTKWSVVYNLSNPKIKVNGEYAIIVDVNGVEAYVFTELGKLNKIISNDVIEKFAISKNGYIALLNRKDDDSYIYVYDKYGENGSVYVKYVMEEDGEPLDVSLSEDGKYMMVSLCKMIDEKIHSYINIYNFDVDIDVKEEKRLIKSIDTYYEDKFVMKVNFLDNKNAVALYNGGITFFELANDECFERNMYFDNIIHSVCIENKKIYIVFENKERKMALTNNVNIENKTNIDDNNLYLLTRYEKNGKVSMTKYIDKNYINFYVTNGNSVFVGLDSVMIIDNYGIIRYEGKMVDNFVYLKTILHFGIMDIIVGLENSFKRILLY